MHFKSEKRTLSKSSIVDTYEELIHNTDPIMDEGGLNGSYSSQ